MIFLYSQLNNLINNDIGKINKSEISKKIRKMKISKVKKNHIHTLENKVSNSCIVLH